MSKPTTVTVLFPSLNKNDILADNDRRIFEGALVSECRIVKTVTLSDEEYEEVADTLLEDRPEMWEGIGGSASDDRIFEGMAWHQIAQNPELLRRWHETAYTLAILVRTRDGLRSFVVNTEGHSYARYVGRLRASLPI